MSTALVQQNSSSAGAAAASRPASGRWILNSWLDLLLFVSTPLLIVPLVFLIQAPWVGVEVATISLIVSAFGGLGHHLPGMIRAYGDRDLFQRFRMRFILAPIFLLAVCIPLSQYHLNAMLLILSVWGCWHALMQVYGFVRIYDVKVGSVSATTAWWDWLMCLSWFSTAQVFSNGKMSRLLEYWYTSGGPLIPPSYVHACRWTCLGISVAVLVGFLVNHVVQSRRGPKPNSVKLLMLASGIGFWWFAMVVVEDIVLGIALFEIAHDVQYLAIVWLYNCRRTRSTENIGAFMRFVFRGSYGMLMIYIGLVFAYGMIALVTRDIQSDSMNTLIRGFVWASTILHFYYDGFIWKVRDNSTRAGLGLNTSGAGGGRSKFAVGEFTHLLKWSPLIIILGWLSSSELRGSTFSSEGNETGRRWPNSMQLDRTLNIAQAVPDDLRAQRRAAITLANFNRDQEAIALLKNVLSRHPSYADGYQVLGEIHQVAGQYEPAAEYYRNALLHARTLRERSDARHRLGEVFVQQKRYTLAEAKFLEVLSEDPEFKASREALQELQHSTKQGTNTAQ